MDDLNTMVPFCVHEAEMSRHEAGHTRDFIEKIILIFLLIITNSCWLWYESQFEYVQTTEEITQEVTQEADGGDNNFVGGDYYGNSKSKDYYTESNEDQTTQNGR